MKINKIYRPAVAKHISDITSGTSLEPHECRTIELLQQFNYKIEIIRPTNTPKVDNPDIMLMGTAWEIKALFKFNENTLKKKTRKASHQADHVIYDLRNLRPVKDVDAAEKMIIKLFAGNRRLRRIIIIKTSDYLLDIYK